MAVITISNTGGNWSNTATWVGGVVPGAGDQVIATATSGNLTCTDNRTLQGIDFTNYVGTFAVLTGVLLTFSGFVSPLRLVAGMSIAATSTGTLIFSTSSSGTPLTSAGLVWPGNITFAAATARNYTLGDNWSIDGNLVFRSLASPATSITMTSFSIKVRGNVTVGDTSSATIYPAVTGTTTIILETAATTTVTTNNTTVGTVVPFRTPLAINATGTVVFSTPGAKLALGNVTYTAGTVTTAGSTIHWNAPATLTTSGMSWSSLIVVTSTTLTLSSALNISSTGSLSLLGNCVINTSAVNLSGNMATGTGTHTGTSTFNIAGTTSTITQGVGGAFRISIDINSSGTVTFSTNFNWGASGITFRYIAGTFSMSSVLTWTNSAGPSNYLMLGSGLTFPTFIASSSFLFTGVGTIGCNFYALISNAPGITMIFRDTSTYNVINQFELGGTLASPIQVSSLNSAVYSVLTISPAATLDVAYVSATRIDSSLGQTVWNYAGNITNTLNWNLLNPQPPNLSAVFS